MIERFLAIPSILRNAIDYPLRQFFHWSRSGLLIRNEPKDNLFAHLVEAERVQTENSAARLLKEYHLDRFCADSTADNYRENLFYLALLEKALNETSSDLPQTIAVADIGSSDWFYVQALYALLKWWRCPGSRDVTLNGYEPDAYRVYVGFHSRFDHAQANLRGLERVHYLPRAFEQHPGAFELITMLFPFVFLQDHLKWGLPYALFKPCELLSDAWRSLKPGGVLVIINQGEREHQAQLGMLGSADIQIVSSFRFDSHLYPYELPRFAVVAQRDD